MDNVLIIVRWIIIVPILFVEHILKGITFVLSSIIVVILAIIYPLVKDFNLHKFFTSLFFYGTTWRGKGFVMARKVFKLWSL